MGKSFGKAFSSLDCRKAMLTVGDVFAYFNSQLLAWQGLGLHQDRVCGCSCKAYAHDVLNFVRSRSTRLYALEDTKEMPLRSKTQPLSCFNGVPQYFKHLQSNMAAGDSWRVGVPTTGRIGPPSTRNRLHFLKNEDIHDPEPDFDGSLY